MSHKCHSLLMGRNGRVEAHLAGVSADLGDSQMIPEHWHPEDQLLFASKGVMTVHTKEGIWVVPPMRAVWIPAKTPHSVGTSGQVSMRTLYFLPQLCRSLPKKCFVMNVSPLLKELILHACGFTKLNRRISRERRIMDFLLDQLQGAGSVPLQLPHPTDARSMRVVRFIMANPASQRTLAKLCKDCGASKRTIQRLFLEETRMSFGKWRQQFRLLRGMELLASGEKVTAAALEAGYQSPSAFISMFRKQLGTTPMQYFRSEIGQKCVADKMKDGRT